MALLSGCFYIPLPMLQKGCGDCMNKWNKADQLLLVVALIFIVSLVLRLSFPNVLLVQALFFCSEAALVGGVADWFAVTALFQKPLGFPWHTALIPRKREKFIVACVKMMQDEFFSKKKLLMRIKSLHLIDIMIEWIEKNQGKELLAGMLLAVIEKSIMRLDIPTIASRLEEDIRQGIQAIPQTVICGKIGAWIVAHHKDEEAFDYMLHEIRQMLEGEAAREKIYSYLEAYGQEQNKSFLAALITLAAQKTNIINFAEAAEIFQVQSLKVIEDLLEPAHPLRRQLLLQFKEAAIELATDETWQNVISKWQNGISGNLVMQEQIERFLRQVCVSFQRQAPVEGATYPVTQAPLAQLVLNELDRGMEIIKYDPVIKQAIDAYLYDLVSRSVLQAQSMIAVVVQDVLKELSDAELNQLIYTKIEQDLLWIRMNGSIVGAIIGLLIFVFLEMVK